MPLTAERAARLVQRHTTARRGLESALVALLTRLWRATVTDPFDGRQAYDFSRRAATATATAEKAATRLAAQTTSAWLADAYDLPARAAKLLAVDSVRGTPLTEVFDRPPAAARYAVLQGLDKLEAELAAVSRIEKAAEASVALATRRGATETMRQAGVTHWRRVIRPELSASGTTCGLCIAASTRVYRVEALMPLHDRCNCLPVPAIRDGRRVDLAEVLNEEDLAAVVPTSAADLAGVYDAAAGSTFAEQLKRTRFAVDEHGELGAVIRLEGRRSRGPREAARARRVRGETPDERRAFVETQIRTASAVIPGLEARAGAGENVTGPLDYQRALLARMQGELDALGA